MSRSGDVPAYLSDLNEQQRRAVLHHGAPLLILAGAGSGKTRVITVKIAYMIEQLGHDPRSILAVTFTNKAAGEMKERAAALAPRAQDTMIRTFHSFGAWFLRRHATLAGMPSGFSIYDDDDSVTLLRSLYPDTPRSTLAAVHRRISRAKDYGLGPEDELSRITGDPEFPEQYRCYEKRLREIGNADFGDLILQPVRILSEHPQVRDRIRSRFRVILVDEYQDSNVAQYHLLQLLADSSTYVCVVGDDDQSIYRFRGAEVRNILTFEETFPGTDVIRLEENYRSTAGILEVAQAVVDHNDGRLGKKLFTRKDRGPRPVFALLEDEEEEVRYCRDVLSRESEIPPGETAILYRTNAQSRLFETVFLREGIPYRIVGTLRFYEREEIKDAVAVLKFLANPRDEVSFRRIANKPSRGIGATTLEKVIAVSAETEGDLREALRRAPSRLGSRAANAVSAFAEVVGRVEATTGGESLMSVVEAAVSETGLGRYHAEKDEVAGTQKLENLEELENASSLYAGTAEGLVEFLESIELDSAREEETVDSPDRVTLITMHNTKGLEFDRVIITGLEEGLFPRGAEESADELEEERRLFYVALTRARRSVHLTSCRSRRVHGRYLSFVPSRFIREIPPELLEQAWPGQVRPGNWAPGRRVSSVASGRSGSRRGPGKDYDGEFPPGAYVYHDEYGPGVVIAAWRSEEEDTVRVRFETGNIAQFIPRYAGLERIGGGDP
ncbi:MAG: ATP-dependent helicase [Spirochaetaceae bacterium]